MKIFFFLVALANVALFMWEYDKGSSRSIEHAESDPFANRERIVLASEMNGSEVADLSASGSEKAAEQPGSRLEPALEAASGPGSIKSQNQNGRENLGEALAVQHAPQACFEAGPFADSDVLAAWQKRLSAAEAEARTVDREGQSVNDYLIYYPAADTAEKSLENLHWLRSQGANDAWMLSQGDMKGGISLGVFKKEERAQAMKSQWGDKGIQVEIMPRYKAQVQKFVLIKGPDHILETLKSLEKSFPDIAVKPEENCS